MTRINCVDVSALTDKHLVSEYRELPRVSGLVWKWQDRIDNQVYHNVYNKFSHDAYIPETYRLGTGHVKFFYDKGEFLRRRFEEEIVPEMQRRGFTTNFTKYLIHPDGMNNDWTPRDEDIKLNEQRIKERLGEKH